MNVAIVEGKEIEFVELLNTLKRTVNNEEYVDRFLHCISIKKEDFDEIYEYIEHIDYEIVNKIHTRLKNKSTISTNNAGKKYSKFSQSSLDEFIDSSHGRQLLSLYSIWQSICQLNSRNSKDKPLLSAFYFYQLMSKYEYQVKTELINSLNNQNILSSIQEQLQIKQIIEFAPSHIYKETDNGLTILKNDTTKDEEIDECLENQIPLYTSHNNFVFKIQQGTFGYDIFFTNEMNPLGESKAEDFDFRLCINLPYENDTQTSLDNISIRYEPTHNIFIADIQRTYNEYKQLFLLNPYSTVKNERLEAESCFIIPLYQIVKQAFKNSNVSKHLLNTITGLIAYDFGIFSLDEEYLPDDNLSQYNDALRKKVMHIINKNNNLLNLG
ncbi:MAG: hypothetical protein N4A74_02660 [Carboxylicivirga sp.]|jgi:hypothetical protein|nr:hypothetical protein [Carboxylicivirga sp.]